MIVVLTGGAGIDVYAGDRDSTNRCAEKKGYAENLVGVAININYSSYLKLG